MGAHTDQGQHRPPVGSQAPGANERIDRGPGGVAGNLTRDPELRYTPSGKAVASLRVAVSERVRDPRSGEWTDGETVYYNITCWGQLAENCAEHLAKGFLITANGRWEEQTWEDREGQAQSRVVLVASDLGPSMRFDGARRVIKRGGR